MTEPLCAGTKRCPRCGHRKHVLCFAADKTGRNGLRSWCRACRAESEAEREREKRWKVSGRGSKHNLKAGAIDLAEEG